MVGDVETGVGGSTFRTQIEQREAFRAVKVTVLFITLIDCPSGKWFPEVSIAVVFSRINAPWCLNRAVSPNFGRRQRSGGKEMVASEIIEMCFEPFFPCDIVNIDEAADVQLREVLVAIANDIPVEVASGIIKGVFQHLSKREYAAFDFVDSQREKVVDFHFFHSYSLVGISKRFNNVVGDSDRNRQDE